MFYFTSPLPDVTSCPSDEKNGQLSRQPSTPSRQNSRRSESGTERERGEKERAADAGSGSGTGSSSGTVLQRRGSGKDKTRLLSSSNGTQSHQWKECCGREAPLSLPSPLSFPRPFLPCFLPSCLASYHHSLAMEWRRGEGFPWSWSKDMTENSPQIAGFSRNVYLWGWRRQVELISSQPLRTASPGGTSQRTGCSKSPTSTEKYVVYPLRIKKAHDRPTDQSDATHGSHPKGNLPSVSQNGTGRSRPMTEHLNTFSFIISTVWSTPDQPSWIIKSPKRHLTKPDESHDRKHALLSSAHFLFEEKCVFSSKATKRGCLLKKGRRITEGVLI